MKRTASCLLAAMVLFFPLAAREAAAESVGQEAAQHPRIATAIREMEEAIKYMEAAPHDFGGHKAAAINATRAAIRELEQALKFRAVADTKKGK